jgi:carbon-monoxide dehydrogenase small subunit
LITSQSYLSQTKSYDRQEIREHIAGNYCRCTGYEAIVDAIEVVAKQRGLHPNEKSL